MSNSNSEKLLQGIKVLILIVQVLDGVERIVKGRRVSMKVKKNNNLSVFTCITDVDVGCSSACMAMCCINDVQKRDLWCVKVAGWSWMGQLLEWTVVWVKG